MLQLLPVIKDNKIPFIFRLKYLVKESINAFQQLIAEVDQWHVFSTQIDTVLLLNGIPSKNIFLSQHGVDKVFTNNNLNSTMAQKNDASVTFLYVGRFDKVKGFHTLLQSWCGLKEGVQRKLEIIGEMQTDDENINKVIKMAVARRDILWHGKKSQAEIAVIMQTVHCTIIPSEWVEIGPLVFHEAISRGCDVIASDIGGCKSLAGLYQTKSTLFKAGNIENLQKAIINFRYSNLTLPVVLQMENYKLVESQYQQLVNA